MSCGLGRRASVEMILENSGLISVDIIDGHCLAPSASQSFMNSAPCLLFSFTLRIQILFLACDNFHELAAVSCLGGPRQTSH